MPCFILKIIEYLGDQYCLLISLDVLDVIYGIEIAFLCQLDSIIFQNHARILKSADLSFSLLHLGIVLLHKLDLMLVGELFFQIFDNFINCRSEGLDVRDECLVVRGRYYG
jgi:hypothetical protein